MPDETQCCTSKLISDSSASRALVNDVTHKDGLYTTVTDFDNELRVCVPADPPTQFIRRLIVRASIQYSSSARPIADSETAPRAKAGKDEPHPVTVTFSVEEDPHLRVVPRLNARSNVEGMLRGANRVRKAQNPDHLCGVDSVAETE